MLAKELAFVAHAEAAGLRAQAGDWPAFLSSRPQPRRRRKARLASCAIAALYRELALKGGCMATWQQLEHRTRDAQPNSWNSSESHAPVLLTVKSSPRSRRCSVISGRRVPRLRSRGLAAVPRPKADMAGETAVDKALGEQEVIPDHDIGPHRHSRLFSTRGDCRYCDCRRRPQDRAWPGLAPHSGRVSICKGLAVGLSLAKDALPAAAAAMVFLFHILSRKFFRVVSRVQRCGFFIHLASKLADIVAVPLIHGVFGVIVDVRPPLALLIAPLLQHILEYLCCQRDCGGCVASSIPLR